MADARTQATTIGKGLYLIFFNKNNRANFLGPVLRRPISANTGLIFNLRFFSFGSKAFGLATSQPHEFLSERTELNFRPRSGQASNEVTGGQKAFSGIISSVYSF